MTVILYNKERDSLQIGDENCLITRDVNFQISSFDNDFLKDLFRELNFEEVVIDNNNNITHIKIASDEHLIVYPYETLCKQINIFNHHFFRKLFEEKIKSLNYPRIFSQ